MTKQKDDIKIDYKYGFSMPEKSFYKAKKGLREDVVRMISKIKKEPDIQSFAEKISELTEQNQELEGNWKRALADYQNYKRRTEQERLEIIKYSNENLMAEIVSVLGNFTLLAKHSEDPGLKITISNFKEVLKRNGLEEIDLLGKKFDANVAEAVETEKGEKDLVLKTLEKGYTYNGKLIKPTRVIVGKGA